MCVFVLVESVCTVLIPAPQASFKEITMVNVWLTFSGGETGVVTPS